MKIFRLGQWSFLLFVLLFFSCKINKRIATPSESLDAGTAMLWEKIKSSNIDFNWYHAKANAMVEFEGFSMGGKTDIRVKRDSVIWISVKKFGFEIARTLIKRDSVFVINRMESSFMALPIDSFKMAYDIPLGFEELQEIIIGNHILDDQFPEGSHKLGNKYILKSKGKQLWVEYGFFNDYTVDYAKFIDGQDRSFELKMSDYNLLDGNKTAHTRAYFYPGQRDYEFALTLKIDQIVIDKPKKIKFDIPDHYTKM